SRSIAELPHCGIRTTDAKTLGGGDVDEVVLVNLISQGDFRRQRMVRLTSGAVEARPDNQCGRVVCFTLKLRIGVAQPECEFQGLGQFDISLPKKRNLLVDADTRVLPVNVTAVEIRRHTEIALKRRIVNILPSRLSSMLIKQPRGPQYSCLGGG